MSLGNIDITDRKSSAPADLIAAATVIIEQHTPEWREDGWDGYWVCDSCESRLTDREATTHIAYLLWNSGYLAAGERP